MSKHKKKWSKAPADMIGEMVTEKPKPQREKRKSRVQYGRAPDATPDVSCAPDVLPPRRPDAPEEDWGVVQTEPPNMFAHETEPWRPPRPPFVAAPWIEPWSVPEPHSLPKPQFADPEPPPPDGLQAYMRDFLDRKFAELNVAQRPGQRLFVFPGFGADAPPEVIDLNEPPPSLDDSESYVIPPEREFAEARERERRLQREREEKKRALEALARGEQQQQQRQRQQPEATPVNYDPKLAFISDKLYGKTKRILQGLEDMNRELVRAKGVPHQMVAPEEGGGGDEAAGSRGQTSDLGELDRGRHGRTFEQASTFAKCVCFRPSQSRRPRLAFEPDPEREALRFKFDTPYPN